MTSKNKGGRRNNKKNKRNKGRNNSIATTAAAAAAATATTTTTTTSLLSLLQSGAGRKRTEATVAAIAVDNDINAVIDDPDVATTTTISTATVSSGDSNTNDATPAPPLSVVVTTNNTKSPPAQKTSDYHDDHRMRRFITAVAVAVGFDASKECYHGSTRAAFLNSDYIREVICNPSTYDKHEEFCQFTFALATEMWFQLMKIDKDNKDERSQWINDIVTILEYGISRRYYWIPTTAGGDAGFGSENNRKICRYYRDIATASANETPCYRGIINVLARETKSNCDCMKLYQLEAKKIEKVGFCSGCCSNVPKMKLRLCLGCIHMIKYCCRKCQKLDWSRHRALCKDAQRCKDRMPTYAKDDVDVTETYIQLPEDASRCNTQN
ncbi:hypothetical protein FRACYDRAFT_248969 [Fragilariopsis cylindrus CCMP1102]|uniref:MYND-type domain-containing protein n=1 Tax=Fragilariopsis cylindrus CCMP1102 TaxID=635003 RepID=A0A1E7ETH2_9STRA|nr:hypothetical protein FRACYDRAFT_248969 [Fragilariopsis cylindrus CCMP1102]|eukprot:OEU09084.1 hypothetical protein FRACYDRAFT_248969 [Fragilariopsis cylindrus CCMP1102]